MLDFGTTQFLLHDCKTYFETVDFCCLLSIENFEVHIQTIVVEYFVRYTPYHFDELCVLLMVS